MSAPDVQLEVQFGAEKLCTRRRIQPPAALRGYRTQWPLPPEPGSADERAALAAEDAAETARRQQLATAETSTDQPALRALATAAAAVLVEFRTNELRERRPGLPVDHDDMLKATIVACGLLRNPALPAPAAELLLRSGTRRLLHHDARALLLRQSDDSQLAAAVFAGDAADLPSLIAERGWAWGPDEGAVLAAALTSVLRSDGPALNKDAEAAAYARWLAPLVAQGVAPSALWAAPVATLKRAAGHRHAFPHSQPGVQLARTSLAEARRFAAKDGPATKQTFRQLEPAWTGSVRELLDVAHGVARGAGGTH